MRIEEVRAEIPKAFNSELNSTYKWIKKNGYFDYPYGKCKFEDQRAAAHMLVDWAYEAGKAKAANNGSGVVDQLSYNVGYGSGYKAAAKNPKAWELEGFNIGDKFECCKDHVVTVEGFIVCDDGVMLVDDDWDNHPVKDCKKVIPDTREKIIKELADWGYNSDCEESRKIAEQFISRIEALGDQ